MHETRAGEMAAVGEVPFGHYYGGVDTTPLFVMLAGAYARRTGDLAFIDKLWPALVAAMAWIEGHGDSNGDGFVDYARGEPARLANQGWKDSDDSIFHADGRMAERPDRAGRGAGLRLRRVPRHGRACAPARRYRARAASGSGAAEALRGRGRAALLDADELGFYAIALDGARATLPGARVQSRATCCIRGCPRRSARRAVAAQLLSRALRQRAGGCARWRQDEARFNPMSYHNGSVWPHDTALCAAGIGALRRARRRPPTCTSELFEAAVHFDMRLPELFCGFARRPGEPPVAYPVACLPQAWASGSVFMMLQACLGVSIDGLNRMMRIDRPALPAEVEHLALRDLAVGDARVDVAFERLGDRVTAAPIGPVPSTVKILVRP